MVIAILLPSHGTLVRTISKYGDDGFFDILFEFKVIKGSGGWNGMLGRGDTWRTFTPIKVKALLVDEVIIEVTCGKYHTCAINLTGLIYNWGGSLGIPEPKILFSLTNAREFATMPTFKPNKELNALRYGVSETLSSPKMTRDSN